MKQIFLAASTFHSCFLHLKNIILYQVNQQTVQIPPVGTFSNTKCQICLQQSNSINSLTVQSNSLTGFKGLLISAGGP